MFEVNILNDLAIKNSQRFILARVLQLLSVEECYWWLNFKTLYGLFSSDQWPRPCLGYRYTLRITEPLCWKSGLAKRFISVDDKHLPFSVFCEPKKRQSFVLLSRVSAADCRAKLYCQSWWTCARSSLLLNDAPAARCATVVAVTRRAVECLLFSFTPFDSLGLCNSPP